jgi:hypothetical protein
MQINKKITFIVMLLAAAGCKPRAISYQVDPALEVYVQKYESIVGHEAKATVKFGTTEGTIIGYCSDYKVTIDIDFWSKASETSKEILIFHELVHCDKKYFKHDNSFMNIVFTGFGTDGEGDEDKLEYPEHLYGTHFCPSSIMRWFMFNSTEIAECYDKNLTYYHNDIRRK